MKNKQILFRCTEAQKAAIAALAKAAGMSMQDYLLSKALADAPQQADIKAVEEASTAKKYSPSQEALDTESLMEKELLNNDEARHMIDEADAVDGEMVRTGATIWRKLKSANGNHIKLRKVAVIDEMLMWCNTFATPLKALVKANRYLPKLAEHKAWEVIWLKERRVYAGKLLHDLSQFLEQDMTRSINYFYKELDLDWQYYLADNQATG